MSTDVDLGALYAAARHRTTDLLAGVDEHLPVPATPGWDVHDVVAHLHGVATDALAGNLEGAGTPPWTAAQVARSRDVPLAHLLAEWAARAPGLEAFLSSPQGSGVTAVVFDVHAHEADLRGALGLPGHIDADYGRFMFPAMAQGIVARVAAAGLPAVRVESTDGEGVGDADAPIQLRLSHHELHRLVFGRRSADQITTLLTLAGCTGEAAEHVDRYIEAIVIFGPRDEPLED